MENLVTYAPYLGGAGLVLAGMLYLSVLRSSAGTERMQEIAEEIHTGAMAFLKREYTILAIFVAVVAGLLAFVPAVYIADATLSTCTKKRRILYQ